MPERIIRITRTLVYEGPESWIYECMRRTVVDVGHRSKMELGEGKSIVETERKMEEVNRG